MYICPGRYPIHQLDSSSRSCRSIKGWTSPSIDFILLGVLDSGVFPAIRPEGGDFKENTEEGKDTAMILVFSS